MEKDTVNKILSDNVKSVTVYNRPRYRPTPSRPHDYIYDPLFTVSSARDHQRCMEDAARKEAEFRICPVLSTMFTDFPNKPRARLELLRPDRVPDFIDKTWEGRQRAEQQKRLDVEGADRHQFFRRPLVPFLQPVIQTVQFTLDGEPGVETETKPYKVPLPSAIAPVTRTQGTQTDYRESETQTLPWSPPFITQDGENPELLTLATLSWGNGLPAGVQEVEMIERARIKRAWETLIPSMTDEKSKEEAKRIIFAMEQDEWALREKEIQIIHDQRLELARQILADVQSTLKDRLSRRLSKFWLGKQQEKNQKIQKIRDKYCREVRKLTMKHSGMLKKYRRQNIIDEHTDFTSELYGPQIRFGEDPRRQHEVIRVKSKLLTNVKGLEMLERLPKRKPAILTSKPRIKRLPYELCIRQTKWTENVLKKLHDELKAFHTEKKSHKKSLRLIAKVEEEISRPETSEVKGISDDDEESYQTAILFQKILRGRAVQTLMYNGKNECQELLDEIKSTQALQQAGMDELAKMRQEALATQREKCLTAEKLDKVEEVVSKLEGETISSTLSFLSKELWRLQDERTAHALSLLAERERHRREAAEAGRRQAEERRRREHDEMFKQVIKVKQDSVDMYLEDIIMESLDYVVEEESRKYVRDLAVRVDQAAQEAQTRGDIMEREEMIAHMIHHYMLPEVDKRMVREKMKARQQKYLLAAHDTIYQETDSCEPQTSDIEQEELESAEAVSTENSGLPTKADQEKVEMKETDEEESLEDMIENIIIDESEEEDHTEENSGSEEEIKHGNENSKV